MGHREDAARQRDEIIAEQDRLSAAHRDDLAQLGEEFDALRRERDHAVGSVDELTRDRDRLAALHAELSGSRQEFGESQHAGPSRLAEECEQLRRQVEDERARASDLSDERDVDRIAHEQAMISLRDEFETARDQAQVPLTETSAAFVPADSDLKQALAEALVELQAAEAARSVMIDALKVAQKQVQDLTYELAEALSEQKRVRSMLNGLGIHVI